MKKFRKIFFIIILIAIISTITFFVGKQIGLNTDISSTNTKVEEKKVSKRTITKTLTATGEIGTKTTEKLSLSTTKYFKTMCTEEDDIVKKGENILKYSNGTYLTAPYNLVISSYSVPSTGSKATSKNYIEVKDTNNLTTNITINENEIANISVNQEVEITLSADTSKTYKGTITKIDGAGTYSSSGTTFSAQVNFKNDGNAKLGMSVSCTINIKEKKDVLTVPIDAVQTTNNKKYVMVVENGETKETEIQTGLSDDEYVEVTSGLKENQVVKVVTTTKQNTIRSNNKGNSSNDRSDKNWRTNGSGRQDFEAPSRPSDMGGEMPSMKNN